MERHLARATTANGLQAAGDPLASGGFGVTPAAHRKGETRRALLTCALAMYPLVGSATIILAAVMLAGGAQAG